MAIAITYTVAGAAFYVWGRRDGQPMPMVVDVVFFLIVVFLWPSFVFIAILLAINNYIKQR